MKSTIVGYLTPNYAQEERAATMRSPMTDERALQRRVESLKRSRCFLVSYDTSLAQL